MITIILFICNFTVMSVGAEGGEGDQGPGLKAIFGGIIIDSNESANNSINTKDAPSIAHIFTATWCTPCVEVEHAIEDVANETDLVMLTFHRFAGETEDPFGSENAEDWWKTTFEQQRPLQPTAIINGGETLIGASQGSYDNIYSKAIEKPNLSSTNESSMIYTSFDSNSSELTWEVTNADLCDDLDIYVNFVEDVAYFPNGSNGLKNYTHIVHHVKKMSGNNGNADLSQSISEINAFDGDDLKIVITFGCIDTSYSDPWEDHHELEEESDSLPHIGIVPTIMTILITSMIISRRNHFESIN
ncbi:MAG: Uncharacterised protein [Methanobacteriota archaeon]|nr:MAG: Uncharacterised protein [Euryarchaeota archaeon]